MTSIPFTGTRQKACDQDLPKAQEGGLRASALSPKNSSPFPTNAFSFLSPSPRHTGGLPRNLMTQQEGPGDSRGWRNGNLDEPPLLTTKMALAPTVPSLSRSRGTRPHQPCPAPVSAKKSDKEPASFLKGTLRRGTEVVGLRWRQTDKGQGRTMDSNSEARVWCLLPRGACVRPTWARYPL